MLHPHPLSHPLGCVCEASASCFHAPCQEVVLLRLPEEAGISACANSGVQVSLDRSSEREQFPCQAAGK